MSGYEGGGTDMGGGSDANYGGGMEYGGWGGMSNLADVDSNIGVPGTGFSGGGLSLGGGTLGLSAGPGKGLALADASGPGLQASAGARADFAGGIGSQVGHDRATELAIAGAKAAIAVTDADIAAPTTKPVAPVAAAKSAPSLIETIGRSLLGLLGLASGTPQGVIGGAMALHSVGSGFVGAGSAPALADGGAPGATLAGSPAPDLFSGGNGPSETTYGNGVATSPVIGWGGGLVNGPSPSGPLQGFPGTGQLGYGFVPGGPQSPTGFAGGGASQEINGLLVLLLAGLSYLVLS